jgi:hypothetical protein
MFFSNSKTWPTVFDGVRSLVGCCIKHQLRLTHHWSTHTNHVIKALNIIINDCQQINLIEWWGGNLCKCRNSMWPHFPWLPTAWKGSSLKEHPFWNFASQKTLFCCLRTQHSTLKCTSLYYPMMPKRILYWMQYCTVETSSKVIFKNTKISIFGEALTHIRSRFHL